jgi:hypothetical protein
MGDANNLFFTCGCNRSFDDGVIAFGAAAGKNNL